MKNIIQCAFLSAMVTLALPAAAEESKCDRVYTVVNKAVAADSDKVLELVKKYVSQNESCACEVVKAAIVASGADKTLVAGIVETAITSAPNQVRIIGQCAVAVAPDALIQVQAVVANYTKGNYQASGTGNVLDFPLGSTEQVNSVGPTVGGPGGFPLFPQAVGVLQPPIVVVPDDTVVVTPPPATP